MVVDWRTGTGFATKQAAEHYPDAVFVGFDIQQGMLVQAHAGSRDLGPEVFHVQADTFELPLADRSVDLLFVQNTISCYEEFCRVCRPGRIIIYVDTSAGWNATLEGRLVEKYRLFMRVITDRVGLGFDIVAENGGL